MNSVDDRITGALDDDDRAFLASLDDDRGMFRQLGDSMTGPLSGWAKFSFALAILIGFGLAYALYRAVTAESLEIMAGWGFTTIGLLIMQGFLKEWMFARMNMLTILREVKRLQLQVSMLEKS